MNNDEILKKCDHTLLKPVATWKDIEKVAEEAINNDCASICIPPYYVEKASKKYGDKVKICTVIGFPNGYNTLDVKKHETEEALRNGADEIDMVINICEMKNGNYKYIENEIKTLKDICKSKILKVIVETCYLTEEEKIKACEIVSSAKADYIKTSTGFGSAGASIDDIKLFKKHVSKNVKIKAAGGISTVDDIENFIKEGCERIGTSRAVKLLSENI